jgi:hypothetical protein
MERVFSLVGAWEGTDATLPARRIMDGELKWETLGITSLEGFDTEEQKALAALAINMPQLAFNGRFGFVGRKAHMVWDEPYNATRTEWFSRELPEMFEGHVAWGASLFGG